MSYRSTPDHLRPALSDPTAHTALSRLNREMARTRPSERVSPPPKPALVIPVFVTPSTIEEAKERKTALIHERQEITLRLAEENAQTYPNTELRTQLVHRQLCAEREMGELSQWIKNWNRAHPGHRDSRNPEGKTRIERFQDVIGGTDANALILKLCLLLHQRIHENEPTADERITMKAARAWVENSVGGGIAYPKDGGDDAGREA